MSSLLSKFVGSPQDCPLGWWMVLNSSEELTLWYIHPKSQLPVKRWGGYRI